MYYLEARQGGRPTVRICVPMAGGIGRRPCNVHMGSPTEREARDKDCVSYTEAHSWRSRYFPFNYAGAGERKDGQASGWHVSSATREGSKEFQTYPSYLLSH